MQIQTIQKQNPIIAIISCAHGDEIVTKEALQYISAECTLQKIIANEEAVPNKRYLHSDLNRIFPGNSNGNHEERLAAKLIPIIQSADFVIDLHTTTSRTEAFSIVTTNQELAEYCPLKKCVIMTMANGRALIDHCNGISLEFSENTSATEIANIVNQTILQFCTQHKTKPEMYQAYGFVNDKSFIGENFVETQFKSEMFFPVLFGEKSYTDIVCLKAKKIE